MYYSKCSYYNMAIEGILFKKHENEDCETLLNVVRYLYSIGYDVRTSSICDHNIPNYITVLPTIAFSNNQLLVGLSQIVNYYETTFGLTNVIELANKFAINNPDYRMTDRSTHKDLKY